MKTHIKYPRSKNILLKKILFKNLFKAISLTIICIAFSKNADAQIWCPNGATWYYTDNSATASGCSRLSYTNDTVINSITCKKIIHYLKGTGFFGQYAEYATPYFTYEQSGVVYLYNNLFGNNKFDTLFNINAQIGDQWHFPLLDPVCADSTYFIKVLNTGIKTLNGFNFKWLYVKTGAFPYGGFSTIDTITERLGYRFDDLGYSPCHSVPDELLHGGLRCYSDDIFPLYSTGISTSCDCSSTGVEVSQKNTESLTSFPNPANTLINLELKNRNLNDYFIEITNIIGQIQPFLSEIKSNSFLINIESLPAGIYFIKAISKSDPSFLTIKIVKE